ALRDLSQHPREEEKVAGSGESTPFSERTRPLSAAPAAFARQGSATGDSLTGFLPRQRIGPELQLDRLRPVLLAAFEVEVDARARGGPQAAAFPAGGVVVDAPVHILWKQSRWIRQAQRNEAPIDERHD